MEKTINDKLQGPDLECYCVYQGERNHGLDHDSCSEAGESDLVDEYS